MSSSKKNRIQPTPPAEPKPKNHETPAVSIPDKQYFKIGEVSSLTGLEPYVLRYWETEFKSIRPVRMGSNQRLYRRRDVEIILEIKRLLYDEGFTIAGAKKKVIHHNHHKSEKERPAEPEPPSAALPETSAAPEAGPLRDLLKSVQHELLELKQLLSR